MSNNREYLNFASEVSQRFNFLQLFGFQRTEAHATLVRYKKDDLQLSVFHGRSSYEIGLEIGRDDTMFSIAEIIQMSDEQTADRYFQWAARTPEGVTKGVTQLAELLRKYGERALRDDSVFFAGLKSQRENWQRTYASDVQARQIRLRAEAAFKRGNFREAVDLYERIRPRLSPVEIKKLEIAKKRV